MGSNTEWNFAAGKTVVDFVNLGKPQMAKLGVAIHDLTTLGGARSVSAKRIATYIGKSEPAIVILLGKAKAEGLVNRISVQRQQAQAPPRSRAQQQAHPPPHTHTHQAPPPPPPPPPSQPPPKPAPLQVRIRAYDQVPIVMAEIEKLIRQLFRDKLATETDSLDKMKQRYLKLKERVTHIGADGQRSTETPEEWTASWMTLDLLFKILQEIRSGQ